VYRCGKLNRILDPTAISCEITKDIAKPSRRILLVGNSHADSIKSTFASVAQALNVDVRFMVDNIPLMPGGVSPERLIKEALNRKIDTVVLHYSPTKINLPNIQKFAKLAKDNNISIAFIMPVPVWDKHVPSVLWRNIKYNETVPVASLDDYGLKNQALNIELSRLAGVGFTVYQIANIFCNNQCQMMNDNGKPLYFDETHLTLSGSELLRGLFHKIITDAGSNGLPNDSVKRIL
jgi:hypothetical protein